MQREQFIGRDLIFQQRNIGTSNRNHLPGVANVEQPVPEREIQQLLGPAGHPCRSVRNVPQLLQIHLHLQLPSLLFAERLDLWRHLRQQLHAAGTAQQRQRTDPAVPGAGDVDGTLEISVDIQVIFPGIRLGGGKCVIAGNKGGFQYKELIQIDQFADRLKIVHRDVREIAIDQMAADIGVSILKQNHRMQSALFHDRGKKDRSIQTGS